MHTPSQHARKQPGFTLLELMITLTVLSIVTMLAAPNFSNFIANQKVKTTAQALLSSFTYARSEAIRQNRPIEIRVIDAGTDWSTGWELAADGTSLRRVSQADKTAISATSNPVTFRRNGRAAGTDVFTICDKDLSAGVTARIVRIDMSGRSSITLGGTCNEAMTL